MTNSTCRRARYHDPRMTRPCSSSKEEQGPSLNGPSLSQREIDEGAFAEELPPLLLCDGDEICTVLSRARSPARLGRRVDAARANGRPRSLLLYRTEAPCHTPMWAPLQEGDARSNSSSSITEEQTWGRRK